MHTLPGPAAATEQAAEATNACACMRKPHRASALVRSAGRHQAAHLHNQRVHPRHARRPRKVLQRGAHASHVDNGPRRVARRVAARRKEHLLLLVLVKLLLLLLLLLGCAPLRPERCHGNLYACAGSWNWRGSERCATWIAIACIGNSAQCGDGTRSDVAGVSGVCPGCYVYPLNTFFFLACTWMMPSLKSSWATSTPSRLSARMPASTHTALSCAALKSSVLRASSS